MAEVKFQHFRRLYRAKGFTIDDLAKATHQSRNMVSYKLGGIYPWSIEDVYALCDLCGIEYQNIPHYFPKHGVDRLARPLVGRIATERDDAAQRLVSAFQDLFDNYLIHE